MNTNTTLITNPNNIVEIAVEGKITTESLEQVADKIKADIEKHGSIRLLEEFRSFEGIDPIALWKDLKQVRLVDGISRVALVADQKWMRTLAEAAGSIVSAEVKSFERSRIEEARTWLKNA